MHDQVQMSRCVPERTRTFAWAGQVNLRTKCPHKVLQTCCFGECAVQAFHQTSAPCCALIGVMVSRMFRSGCKNARLTLSTITCRLSVFVYVASCWFFKYERQQCWSCEVVLNPFLFDLKRDQSTPYFHTFTDPRWCLSIDKRWACGLLLTVHMSRPSPPRGLRTCRTKPSPPLVRWPRRLARVSLFSLRVSHHRHSLGPSHTSSPQTMSLSPRGSIGRLPLAVGCFFQQHVVRDLTTSNLLVVFCSRRFACARCCSILAVILARHSWVCGCPISWHPLQLSVAPNSDTIFFVMLMSLPFSSFLDLVVVGIHPGFTFGSVPACAAGLCSISTHTSFILQRFSEDAKEHVSIPALFIVLLRMLRHVVRAALSLTVCAPVRVLTPSQQTSNHCTAGFCFGLETSHGSKNIRSPTASIYCWNGVPLMRRCTVTASPPTWNVASVQAACRTSHFKIVVAHRRTDLSFCEVLDCASLSWDCLLGSLDASVGVAVSDGAFFVDDFGCDARACFVFDVDDAWLLVAWQHHFSEDWCLFFCVTVTPAFAKYHVGNECFPQSVMTN